MLCAPLEVGHTQAVAALGRGQIAVRAGAITDGRQLVCPDCNQRGVTYIACATEGGDGLEVGKSARWEKARWVMRGAELPWSRSDIGGLPSARRAGTVAPASGLRRTREPRCDARHVLAQTLRANWHGTYPQSDAAKTCPHHSLSNCRIQRACQQCSTSRFRVNDPGSSDRPNSRLTPVSREVGGGVAPARRGADYSAL
jgi:hypothetical protein